MKNFNLKKVLCIVLSITMLFGCALVGANAQKTIVRGDVNGDGQLQTSDARLALRGAATLDVLEGDAFIAADVDEDGVLKTSDARAILRVAAGLEFFDDPEIVIEEESTDAEEPSEEETTDAPVAEEPSEEESTDAPVVEEPSEEETTDAPVVEEPESQEPETEEPAPEGPVEIGRGEYPEAIDALFSGNFYMKTKIENADGTASEVEMGLQGDKMEVVMPMEGMKMAVLFDGNATYVKIKFGIWYVSEITEELAGEGMDFDVSNMTESFQYGNIDDFKSIVKYNDTLDNKEYTVYSFISENDNDLCFYADENNNIKSIITKDDNGTVTSRNDIDTLSADIPDSMFKKSGFGYVNIDLEGLMGVINGNN